MKLVLFDIDGTLIHSNRNGRLALIQAVESVFGKEIITLLSMAGMTDTKIVYDMVSNNYSRKDVQEKLPEVFNLYLKNLKEYFTLKRGVKVYSGVVSLLEALSIADDCVIGLLTGNMHEGAWVKLRVLSIDKYFRLGAFGDDGFLRSELPEIALERAYKELNLRFANKEIVIIGDTIHDIECGRHLDVKTIAICSNKSSEKELNNANPDYFFHNLEDTNEIIKAIFE